MVLDVRGRVASGSVVEDFKSERTPPIGTGTSRLRQCSLPPFVDRNQPLKEPSERLKVHHEDGPDSPVPKVAIAPSLVVAEVVLRLARLLCFPSPRNGRLLLSHRLISCRIADKALLKAFAVPSGRLDVPTVKTGSVRFITRPKCYSPRIDPVLPRKISLSRCT
jgi:hypothetical protein